VFKIGKQAVPILKSEYTISGDKILNSGKPIQLIGANAFHSFGASTIPNDAMKSWNRYCKSSLET
jgi:hypothetical protein